jgi:ATP-dependent Clp protease protease subunit
MTQQLPEEIYASLAGPVDNQMVQRIFNTFSLALNGGVKTVHLLIQSTGGFVGDGIAIYNYFRSLPINIVSYNCGSIFSIAVVVFLGAKERKAIETATFGIHKSHNPNAAPATSENLRLVADALRIDDERTEKILRENITLSPEKWRMHERGDLSITANEAKEFGLIHEVGGFHVPPGNQICNI